MLTDTEGGLRAIHTAERLSHPEAIDLRHLNAEQAATAIIEAFLNTGMVQAWVSDPGEVRRLIRRGCRQRKAAVRTIAASSLVVVLNEQRHQCFLGTTEGQRWTQECEHITRRALDRLHAQVQPARPPFGPSC